MMKIVFHLTSKALLFLKIFNFCLVFFDQVYSNTQLSTQVRLSQYESIRVNTNQHESDTSQPESTRVQHESTRINASPTQVN